MIIVFFLAVLVFFPLWFAETWVFTVLGMPGQFAAFLGFVGALLAIYAAARFIVLVTAPAKPHPPARLPDGVVRRRPPE